VGIDHEFVIALLFIGYSFSMFGYISGTIKDVLDDKLIILTQSGVGYTTHFPSKSGYLSGQQVELYLYTAVRENEISLWGFGELRDLQMFELLLGVSGVGLKTAYTLLSEIGLSGIVRCILQADTRGLKAPGVGKKTGERIVLELKDKLSNHPELMSVSNGESPSQVGGSSFAVDLNSETVQDAITALEGLGYKRYEVEQAIRTLSVSEYGNAQELVRLLLTRV
jgi:Holliday junction DNA helicase RuvA